MLNKFKDFLNKDSGLWTANRKRVILSSLLPMLISWSHFFGATIMLPYMYLVAPLLLFKFGYKAIEVKNKQNGAKNQTCKDGTSKLEKCALKEKLWQLGSNTYKESALKAGGAKLLFIFVFSLFFAIFNSNLFSALPYVSVHIYCFIINAPLSIIREYLKRLNGATYRRTNRDPYPHKMGITYNDYLKFPETYKGIWK